MAETPRAQWLSLTVLCLGAFAILLDGTIVNTAIPSILTDLHAPFDLAVWVINAYLLVLAALLILAGRLGDIFGPRRMFVVGLAVFGISSALCGAAQTGGELVGARVLQGVGAAALAPQGLVLIRAIFPRDRMGAAFGVFSSTIGLAAVCGPTLGGVLITSLGWRSIFYVNPPIALIGIIGSYAVIPDVRTGRRHRLDPVGVLLAGLGLTAVMYAVIEGQRHAWGTVAAGITIPEILIAGGAAAGGVHDLGTLPSRAAGAARPVPHPHLRDHGRAQRRRAVRVAVAAPGQLGQHADGARHVADPLRPDQCAAHHRAGGARAVRRPAHRPLRRQVHADRRADRLRARHRRRRRRVHDARHVADVRPTAAGRGRRPRRDLRTDQQRGHARGAAGVGRIGIGRHQHRALGW